MYIVSKLNVSSSCYAVKIWTPGVTGLLTVLTVLCVVLVGFTTLGLCAEVKGPIDANIFVNLAKKTVPSVVNISTLSTVKSPFTQGTPDDLFRKFFEDFFGRDFGARGDNSKGDDGSSSPPSLPKQRPNAIALGSGFIIDSSGIILTNNHVVAGADEIKIQFTEAEGETPTDGVVIGRDPELDVALIRVKTERKMVPIALGNSDQLEVGEYVLAVGNPFGQGHTVTHGIISAKGRLSPDFPMGNYLQTDAPINPGNSGGPLINLNGEVIGMNTAIEARAQGIGFAIPMSLVNTIIPQLKSKGTVTRGYVGVLVGELTPDIAKKLGVSKALQAPFVTYVYPGGPADQIGLKPYDIILSFNGKPIRTATDLIGVVSSTSVGQTVPLEISRNGSKKVFSIKIAPRPSARNESSSTRGDKNKKQPPHINTGMSLENITPDIARQLGINSPFRGVLVTDVNPGTPADLAGLTRGDVIIEVDKNPISNVKQFYSIVKYKKEYLLRVRRIAVNNAEAYVVIVLNLGA